MGNKKGLIIILIILLIIAIGMAGLFWYLSVSQNRPEPKIINTEPIKINEPVATVTPVVVTEPVNVPNVEKPTVSEEDKTKAQLVKLVAAFVERYGSYSNQSDYENLEDLMRIMSDDLKNWAENFVADKRAAGIDETVYYGITTKVLKVDIVAYEDVLGRATFKASTQKREVVGSTVNAKVYYKDVNVEMIKEGGIWKVNTIN